MNGKIRTSEIIDLLSNTSKLIRLLNVDCKCTNYDNYEELMNSIRNNYIEIKNSQDGNCESLIIESQKDDDNRYGLKHFSPNRKGEYTHT